MRLLSTITLALAGLGFFASVDSAALRAQQQNSPRISRGKYLVERVAMCVDCHSPRDQKGQFVKAKWLLGGPLEFKPIHPMPAWAEYAPAIAGLPGWSEADAVKLLQTGKIPSGAMLRPPMPPYQMSAEDAAAVVAYLKSLAPPKR